MRTAKALPELFTARYLSGRVADLGGDAVPVRVSMREPIVPLPYDLQETARTLVPPLDMVGEWPWLSPAYWELLDGRGLEAVSGELSGISERHGGRPLVLLDHENTTRGDRSLRVVFAAWWEERAGREVLELADEGRDLRYDALPKRIRPKRPKDWRTDGRWRDDGALGLSWPLSEEDLRRWISLRHWQQARSPHNPHAYTVRHWGDDRAFWLVVQHMREHGEQEVWGGQLFTFYVCDGTKFWTMGADLMSTVILNRKPFGQDPQDRERGAREPAPSAAGQPAEVPLFDRDGRPLSLVERINAEHRACALAAGATVRHAIRCGGLLCEAKAGVKHGNWLPWLRGNTGMAPRTAQLCMKLHRESSEARGEAGSGGETTLRPANTQAITHLEAEATRRETA